MKKLILGLIMFFLLCGVSSFGAITQHWKTHSPMPIEQTIEFWEGTYPLARVIGFEASWWTHGNYDNRTTVYISRESGIKSHTFYNMPNYIWVGFSRKLIFEEGYETPTLIDDIVVGIETTANESWNCRIDFLADSYFSIGSELPPNDPTPSEPTGITILYGLWER